MQLSLFLARSLVGVTLLGTLALVGCSGGSPAELTASGKKYLDNNDAKAAVIQLKSALAKDSGLAEARYLLGTALLQAGDPVGAAVELGKARTLKVSDDLVVPPLARALLLIGQTKALTDQYANTQLTDKTAAADLKSSLVEAWFALKEPAKAEQALADALSASPNFGQARILQARVLASKRKMDEAQRIIDDVLIREPKLAGALQLKGELLLFTGTDVTQAEAVFRRALETDASFVPAHSALFDISMQRKDIEGMQALVAKLKAVLPKHPQTRLQEAQLAFAKKDYKTARELTQVLLRSAPEHPGTLQLSGAIEYANGSLQLAESHLQRALQIAPQFPMARRILAQTYVRQGRPAKALEVLKPLLEGESGDPEAIAVGAEAFLQLNDPRRAEALFARASKLNPDDPRLLSALALSRLARGEVDAAFMDLKAISAKDKGPFADLAMVSAYLRRNELDAALVAADTLVKKVPERAQAYAIRGQIHSIRKDATAARADYYSALKIDPLFLPAVSGLASLDLDENKPEVAIKRFDEVLRLDAGSVMATLAIAEIRSRGGAPKEEIEKLLVSAITASPNEPRPRILMIDLHLRSKDFKSALAAARDALAALPSNVDVMDAAGRAQLAAGDMQQALSSFRKMAGIDPQSALPHLRLAETHLAMRDKRAAEASLKKALDIQPDLVPAQQGIIELALSENRPKDALAVSRNMQRQQPRNPAGYLLDARLNLRLKDSDAAITAYRAGLQQTQNPQIAVELHGTLVKTGKRAEAERLAASWEKEHPSDATFDRHMANVAYVAGDLAQAEVRLKRVVAAQPKNAEALNNLAVVLLDLGKPGATPYAEQANALAPGQPALMYGLARALAADNQLPKALEIQKKAIERAPEDMALRVALARMAIQAGDKVLARTELEKVARQGKRFGRQDEVAKLLKTL